MSTGDKGVLCGKEATDDQIVKAYRAKRLSIWVSVAKYTTGFDVSHTEGHRLVDTEKRGIVQIRPAWRWMPQ